MSRSAASATVRVSTPSKTNGRVPPNASGRPMNGTRPNDCMNPKMPHHDAGMRIEPPPSVPSANDSSPSATAAAPPPDEPPLLRVVSNGLRVGPKSTLSHVARNPMTGLLVLPITIAPARSIRSAQMQLTSSVLSRSAGMPPNVAGQPGLKSNRSLIAVGTPCSGPSGAPEATAASASRARARDSSKARCTNALRLGSRSSIRASVASSSSAHESRRSRIARASPAAGIQASSSPITSGAGPGRTTSRARG